MDRRTNGTPRKAQVVDWVVIHQATGMISAQLGVPTGEALHRLRAYAASHCRSVTDVAAAVVKRGLRFDTGVMD